MYLIPGSVFRVAAPFAPCSRGAPIRPPASAGWFGKHESELPELDATRWRSLIAEDGLLGLHRLRRYAQLLDAMIRTALEGLVATKPLACAHQLRDSPGGTAVAIRILRMSRHPSRPDGGGVADKSWEMLCITFVLSRLISCDPRIDDARKQNGRLAAPVCKTMIERLRPLPGPRSP